MSYVRPNHEVEPIANKDPWAKVKSLLWTMGTLALGYILLLAYLNYHSNNNIQQIFGGTAGLQVLNHADAVAAYRLDKPPGGDKGQEFSLPDFPITDGPISVSKPDVETLLNTLQDRDSYIWDSAKACAPLPGVRLDFIRGNDRLSILICFECDMIINYLNGKPVGGGNTDNVRPTLLQVAKSLFPDDATIQSLKP